MKDHKKYYEAVQKIDPHDEAAIRDALEDAGLYSKPSIFPLATLHLELTEHCNAACKHCYNNSGVSNDIPDAMTPEKWISFAKYLVAHGGVFECIISGGEPLLLGDKMFELMDVFHDDGTYSALYSCSRVSPALVPMRERGFYQQGNGTCPARGGPCGTSATRPHTPSRNFLTRPST